MGSINEKGYVQCFADLGLFGSGVSILSSRPVEVGLEAQFPRIGSNAAEPWTLRDTVLEQNCRTVGLSLRPPAALCLPKKDSRGSWQSFSDKMYSTPGTAKRNCVISMKECTACMHYTINKKSHFNISHYTCDPQTL